MTDPRYADLDQVYREEISPQRLRVTQTPKTPTEPSERDTDQGA